MGLPARLEDLQLAMDVEEHLELNELRLKVIKECNLLATEKKKLKEDKTHERAKNVQRRKEKISGMVNEIRSRFRIVK